MDDRTAGAGDGPVDRIPPIGQLTRHTPVRDAKMTSELRLRPYRCLPLVSDMHLSVLNSED